MKKIITTTILGSFLLSGNVHAVNFAVITSPPTIISLVLLLVALVCLYGVLKVLALLKGGYLSKSWQLFMSSFIVLALSQMVNLVNDFELLAVPSFLVPALLLVTSGLFLYGIFETKQTLE
jgi:hypothetical protein